MQAGSHGRHRRSGDQRRTRVVVLILPAEYKSSVFKYIWVSRVTRGQVLGSKFIRKVFRRLKSANWRLQNWNVEFSCLKNFDITLQKENTVSKVSHSKNWIRSRAEFHETQNVESVKITPFSIGYLTRTREGSFRFGRNTDPKTWSSSWRIRWNLSCYQRFIKLRQVSGLGGSKMFCIDREMSLMSNFLNGNSLWGLLSANSAISNGLSCSENVVLFGHALCPQSVQRCIFRSGVFFANFWPLKPICPIGSACYETN